MRVYKVIPGPVSLRFQQNDITVASTAFQDILNEQAKLGWIFHSMQEIDAHQDAEFKRGCFGPKEIQSAKAITMSLLIFYSDVEEKKTGLSSKTEPQAEPHAQPAIDDAKA